MRGSSVSPDPAPTTTVRRSSVRPPVLGPSVVPRAGVVKRLVDAAPGSVVVLTAPGGYGKTTTAALWAGADPRPFAWVVLDHLDRDPAYLLRHLAHSVALLDGVDDELVRYVDGPGRSPEMLRDAVLDALDRADGHWVLVVDDTHLLDDQPSASLVGDLVDQIPQTGVVALSGRTAPPGVGRLRLTDRLVELGPADLAVSVDEAREVFAEMGTPIEEDRLVDLLDRCEGWVAGVHLAALAVRDDRSGSGEAVLSGRQRLVADYLVEQVLATLDPDTAAFLEEASVVDRMSGPLLDDVLGRHDSGARLAEVEASGNLLLVPLDDERRWYRFHHLLADLLRARLEDRDSARARTLHRRASEWAEHRGDLDTAIRHAVAAGDGARAAGLVQREAVELAWGGRGDVLRRRLGWLDDAARTGNADAALAQAWLAATAGDAEGVHRALHGALAADSGAAVADGTTSVEVAVALVRAMLGDGGLDGVIGHARVVRASGGLGQARWWGLATAIEGTALAHQGRGEQAEALLAEALPALGDLPGAAAVCHAHLALLASADGDLTGACRQSDEACAIVDRHDLADLVPVVFVYAVSALVGARSGQAARARRDIAVAERSLARLGGTSPRTGISSRIALGWAHHVLQDGAGARRQVDEAARLFAAAPLSEDLGRQIEELREVLTVGPRGSSLAVTPLTEAELRVLPLLPTHLSLPQIAAELHVSRNTVKTHCVSIYRKLGVSSRAGAVAESRRLGLLAG